MGSRHCRALQDAGVDQDMLLRRIGMDPERLLDLNHRYSQEQVTSLWWRPLRRPRYGNSPEGGASRAAVDFSRRRLCHGMQFNAQTSGRTLCAFRPPDLRRALIEFKPVGAHFLLTVDLHTIGRQPIYQTIDTILAALSCYANGLRALRWCPPKSPFARPAQ